MKSTVNLRIFSKKILIFLNSFQYPSNLKIKEAFFDFGKEETGDFVGRIKINLNEETKSLSANRNFLSLLKGNSDRSFIGYNYYYNGNEILFYNRYLLPPAVILPSKGEKREVTEWSVKYGDIYQLNPNNDDGFSRFIIILSNKNRTTTHPKLGSVVNNIEFFRPGNYDKIIDCGIITE